MGVLRRAVDEALERGDGAYLRVRKLVDTRGKGCRVMAVTVERSGDKQATQSALPTTGVRFSALICSETTGALRKMARRDGVDVVVDGLAVLV